MGAAHNTNPFLGTFYEQMAVYAGIAFVVVLLSLCLVHFICMRRFRLNWYERMNFENAKAMNNSTEALVNIAAESSKGSTLTISGTSMRSHILKDEKHLYDIDDGQPYKGSVPGTPTSESSFGGALPSSPDSSKMVVTGGERHMVLSSVAPAWPKVTSMQAKLHHTQFDASLYKNNEDAESLASDVRAMLHMSLSYDSASSLLTVHLIEANDIQPREFSGTADPYAKVRLLPDKENVWQTRIHKKTLNPVFDEDFVFEVSPADMSKRVLEILLCDFDAYSRHHFIGSLQLPLRHIDFGESVSMWRALEACVASDASLDLGELMVSLSYLPSAGRLTVVIVKARNLKIVDETRSTSDPFVKVTLLMGQKRVKKRKTTIQRNNLCPVFNEAVNFDIKREMLKKCAVEFCVFHDNLIGGKEMMGGVVMGNSPLSTYDDKIFFNDIPKTKSAVAKWLRLKDTTSA